jgi:two-component system, NtrC family, sensor kinase
VTLDDAHVVLEAMPVGVFLADARGDCRFVNRKFCEMTGARPETMIGCGWLDIVHPDDRATVLAGWTDAAREGREYDVRCRCLTPGGFIWILGRGTPLRGPDGELLGWVGTAVDISARVESEQAVQRSESRLRVSERLAALGTLSAGVAHEINNPLTYVQVQLIALQDGLAELEGPPDPGAERRGVDRERVKELQSMAADAHHGMQRIAKIVRSLRSLSRSHDTRPSPRDLGRVIDQALQLVAAEVRRRAKLVCNIDDVPPVMGDDARLGQVIVNLVLNAVQSIPTKRGEVGTIVVTLSTGAQGWIVVEVVDDGVGISEEAKARVFDPFYTSDASGQALGLGLSVTHGIVESLGGRIELNSEPGRGTCVRVSFPPAPLAAAG